MYGDRRPYPVALITLETDNITTWADEHGLPTDVEVLARHPRVRALIQQAVDTANARHARPGRIKKFALLPRDFTQEAGELTPTLKLKRAVIHDHYAHTLDTLYTPSETQLQHSLSP